MISRRRTWAVFWTLAGLVVFPHDRPAQADVPSTVIYDNLAAPSDVLFFSGQNGQEPRDDLHAVGSGPLYRITFDYDDPSGLPGTISATVAVYGNPGGSDVGTPLLWGPHTVDGLPRGRNRFSVVTTAHPLTGPDLWVGVRFSSTTAGLVLHDPPALGFSHDYFNENGGLFHFQGNPVANFALQVETVVCPPPGVVYVDAAAAGANDGTSWTDAYTSLDDGLITASACAGVTEVWVAAGTYLPTTFSTFRLPDGVPVYGGFAGGETLLSQRDWAMNETVLSGDLGVPVTTSDNALHVVTAGPSAYLDGFTVRDGGTGIAPGTSGGGIDATAGGAPTFSNLYITENMAHEGGGMASVEGTPALTNVAFRKNTATSGGGLHNTGGAPTLLDVVLKGNRATGGSGGAIYNEGGALTLTSALVDSNSATLWGGGLFNGNGAVVITNATFYENGAGSGGGAIANDTTVAYPEIWNSILWGNFGPSPEIHNTAGGQASVQFSTVEGSGGSGGSWNASLGLDGGGNIDLDPLFADPIPGDMRLDATSPARDMGSELAPNLPATDLDGNPRIYGSTVDMGAYEIQTPLGTVIQPVAVLSTSQWGGGVSDGRAANLIDGSGLSGGGPVESQTHDNAGNAATMWHAGDVDGGLGGPTGLPPAVATQALVFDLGATYDLLGAFIWNHNQIVLTSRGVAQLRVLTSSDSDPLSAVFSVVDTLMLTEAAGAAEPAQHLTLNAPNARLVRFELISAHSAATNEYVGLSEVRFVGDLVTLSTPIDHPAEGGLALANARRNPARRLAYRITLPDETPCRLEVFDLSGRRVFVQDVSTLGPGSHVVDTRADLAPGIYLARLGGGQERRIVRSVVVR